MDIFLSSSMYLLFTCMMFLIIFNVLIIKLNYKKQIKINIPLLNLCIFEMKRNWLISVLAVFIIIILRAPYGNGAKILGFFSAPSKSHLIIHISLMNELANRGHEVKHFYSR